MNHFSDNKKDKNDEVTDWVDPDTFSGIYKLPSTLKSSFEVEPPKNQLDDDKAQTKTGEKKSESGKVKK